MRLKWSGLAALVWLHLGLSTTSQAMPPQIHIHGSRLTTIISSASAAWETESSLPIPLPALPYQGDLVADAAPSHSDNSVKLSAIAEQYVFSVDIRHSVDGPPGARFGPAARTIGHITVTPLNDTPYHVSGFYNVTDNSGSGSAYSRLTAYVDNGGSWIDIWDLFSQQTNTSTHDSRLMIGEAGGDLLVDRFNFGSTSGILLSGHKYSIGFDMSMNTSQPDQNGQFPGASAVGKFNVIFGGFVVPEPSCSTLFAVGMLSIVNALAARRRQFRSINGYL